VPLSIRWVAKLCLSVWNDTGFLIPACSLARSKAFEALVSRYDIAQRYYRLKRRLLGLDMDLGGKLGLGADWTQRVIRQVGNYGELFERNLGLKSPLKLERRLNGLASQGGLHYAPAFR